MRGAAVLCVLLAEAPALGAPGDAVSEARLVSAALDGLKGLVAAFTQTTESPALPSPQVERGTVYLLRPGRVRFEYAEPPGKLAIAEGQRTYLYLPDERQVLVAPLGAQGTRSGIALLLEERIDLLREFTIAWGPEPEPGASRPLLLTPRAPRAEFQYLLVTTGADHLIAALAVVDALGSRVTYRFTRARTAETLDAALFRFIPPAGVVVRQASP